MGERRVFGRSFHEYENEPSPQKKKLLNIVLTVFALLIIVLGGIFVFIFWQSNQSQPLGVESPLSDDQLSYDTDTATATQINAGAIEFESVEQNLPIQDRFADLPLYQDLALGVEFRHSVGTFTQVDSGLSDPVLANVYLVPREFRTADGNRDIRFTVNRNVTSSTADDWVVRTLPRAQILQRLNGFVIARYTINDQQMIVAVQAVRGNLLFFYLPGDTVTETFRNLIDSFAFIE